MQPAASVNRPGQPAGRAFRLREPGRSAIILLLIMGSLATSIAHAQCNDATVSGETELNAAIDDFNNNCSDGDVMTVTVSSTIALSDDTTAIDDLSDNGGELAFTGGGTLDGSASHRLLDIVDADVTIDDLTLLNGNATTGAAINVETDGVLTVSGSVFENHSASNGAAIDNQGDTTVADSRFQGSDATQNGGAIRSNGTLAVTGSTFVANTASSQGGAIRSSNTLAVTNSTLVDNTAGEGGAISNGLQQLDITNSTIHGNSAGTSGGGIHNGGGTVTIDNAIVANSTGDDCVNDGGTWNSPEANLDSDGSCPGFTIQNADPLLEPLADNGGPTETMAPQAASPAVEAATNCPPPATDQRGLDRPQGAACDLGAHELSCQDRAVADQAGLNDAIAEYNNNCLSVDTLTVTIAGTITYSASSNDIGNDNGAALVLSGGGTLDGNNLQILRVSAGDVTVSELTLRNGGGGIFGTAIENHGSLTLARTTVQGNQDSDGGAIGNLGDLGIVNATLHANSGDTIVNQGGSLEVTHTTIQGNGSSTSDAIRSTGSVTITNSIVSGNDGANCHNDGGTWSSQEANLDGDGSCPGFTIQNADPLLEPLADYGGPTQSLALQPGSPALDAATNCPPPATDQRGVGRAVGSACELGAFESRILTVAIDAAGNGAGTVTATGIACDLDAGSTSGDCQESHVERESVTLTADPDPFNDFTGWSGDCSGTGAETTVILDADKTCTAEFEKQTFSLAVAGAGNGDGTVTSDPGDVDCTISEGSESGTCQQDFDGGTEVTLTASPATLTDFAGWGGDCSGTDPETTVTVDGDLTCTAELVNCQDATVTTESELNDALSDYHLNCNAGETLTATISGTITLTGNTGGIFNDTGASLVLDGGGTLDGNDSHRILEISAGDVTLDNLTLRNGTAGPGSAGAISNGGTLTVGNSTLKDNTAGDGAAIVNSGTLNLINSTLTGNAAGNIGGAVLNSGVLDITNSTLHGNSASEGGGIWSNSSATVANSIVSGNTGGDCHHDGGTWNAQEANLDSDGSCPDFTIQNTDPLLEPLADNGGPTETLALEATSPAVDAATNCPPPATDQRGISRPQGAACDLGAYELRHFTLTVDGAGDGTGTVEATGIDCAIDTGSASGDCQSTVAESEQLALAAEPELHSRFVAWSSDCSGTDPQTTVTLDADKNCTAEFTAVCQDVDVSSETDLNDAIDEYNANCSDGETLTATLTGSIVLTAGTNPVSNTTTAQLVLAGGETLDGNENHRILDIADGHVTVDNLTLQNASADVGGAIRNGIDADLHVIGTLFDGNDAWGESSGAILNDGALVVDDSTFLGNTADEFAGAISNPGTATITESSFIGNGSSAAGAIRNTDSLDIVASTFAGNAAESGVGGAIENTGTLTVSNSSFDANTTHPDFTPHGGAIYNSNVLEIAHSTVHGNVAADEGGGIWNSGSATVTNTILSDNSGDDCFNDGGTWNAQEANLDSDGSCSDFTITDDPLLEPLADNGGPTQTLALQPGSPAIDAATTCPPPATDQRGVSRPQGPACDLGSFELQTLTLAIDGAGTGKGSVEATGIACDIDAGTTSGDCQEPFTEDQTVTITAQPDPFSDFAGWSGDCSGTDAETSVTLDADKTCTAAFGSAADVIFGDRFESDP